MKRTDCGPFEVLPLDSFLSFPPPPFYYNSYCAIWSSISAHRERLASKFLSFPIVSFVFLGCCLFCFVIALLYGFISIFFLKSSHFFGSLYGCPLQAQVPHFFLLLVLRQMIRFDLPHSVICGGKALPVWYYCYCYCYCCRHCC